MYAVVKWPRNMALGKVVYSSGHFNIVSLNTVPDSFSRNKTQGYITPAYMTGGQ